MKLRFLVDEDCPLSLETLLKAKELEKECDRLVYQLYGLTEAEIKIVEGANDGK